jgi:hypothetical protein
VLLTGVSTSPQPALASPGVDHPEHGRSRQEDLRPGLMDLEETKEQGPIGTRFVIPA